MPTQPRLLDTDLTFFSGMRSDTDPSHLAQGYYWLGFNVINDGGLISCRPGYRCIVTLPEGNLQGGALFQPKVGLEQAVICVSGQVYVAPWPFSDWRLLDNVQLSPNAKRVYFVMTEQTAERLTEEVDSAIRVRVPRRVMFIQDGAKSAPAWYDGSNSGQLRDNIYDTPTGGVMAWSGDRLWVARGSLVYASDIGNPFSFREQTYLGGTAAFTFPGDVTAIATTPGSVEVSQLLVYTRNTTHLVQSNIRTRSLWPSTVDMSREILRVGCVAPKSVGAHFGQMYWMSQEGFVTWDSSFATKRSARLPARDAEMAYSAVHLHDQLDGVCAGAFDRYILMSVPSGDLYNNHTWVLNDASLESLKDESGPSWASIWIGTRPVEWFGGEVAGANRMFYVSHDEDGQNRLWQAFMPDRLDNDCPIHWCAAMRGYFGLTTNSGKTPYQDCKFGYADIGLAAIEGDVDIAVWYAGSARGAFKQIGAKQIRTAQGMFNYTQSVDMNTEVFAYKAQSRRLRTCDAQLQEDDTGSCPVESDNNEDRDDSFQLLIAGHGPCSIRWVRAWAIPESEEWSGDPAAREDEEGVRAIRFDGAGAKGATEEEAQELLAGRPLSLFTGHATTSLSLQGNTEVGSGTAHSIVSQEAADRSAAIRATKAAEVVLIREATPALSAGEGF